MDLNAEIFKLTCDLYKMLKYSEQDVDFILNLFRNFYTNVYNPFLLSQFESNIFPVMSPDNIKEIKEIFDQNKDPFVKYSSKVKRNRIYKGVGLYVEPECNTVDEKKSVKRKLNVIQNTTIDVNIIHIPLKQTLKLLLETKGLLNATLDYMRFLDSQPFPSTNPDVPTIMFNFIQGSTWKRLTQNFHKPGIKLPLIIGFDDVECGNALGSHSGKNALGIVSATIPCFPREFASKLRSIVISDIFYTKDRKSGDNKKTFKPLICELNDLRNNGIKVEINGKVEQIYFLFSFLNGDNLGANSVLGFVASFSRSHSCRICYAGPDEIKSLTEENKTLLRTEDSHFLDSNFIKTSVSGVKEPCVFNEVNGFDVIRNSSVDVAHDVFEGVANYVMTNILLECINADYFEIDFVNNMLKNMSFEFENNNIPQKIDLEYVKNNKRLKMSMAEMLCFTRYFGLMFSHLVDVNSEWWHLYKMFRKIINILTAPSLTMNDLDNLETLINQHHSLYIKLGKELTYKFHMLLHYRRLILQNGPPIHVSSIRNESKYTEIKAIANATSSRLSLPKTISERYLKSIMHYKFSTYKNSDIIVGPAIVNDYLDEYFSEAKKKYSVSRVVIDNVAFKPETIILVDIGKIFPLFGEIEKVYIIDEKIFFLITPFLMIGFDENKFAWSVLKDPEENKKIVEFDSLAYKTPCITIIRDEIQYIATRHRI